MTNVLDHSEPQASSARGGSRARTVAAYLEQFERVDRRMAAVQPDWLNAARRAAIARFSELGFPTTRQEAWRLTGVAPVAEQPTVPAEDGVSAVGAGAVGRLAFSEVPIRVVLVNGRFVPSLSDLAGLPPGVVVAPIGTAWRSHATLVTAHLTRVARDERQAFVALNTAFLGDGAIVSIPAHTVLDAPIHVLFVSKGRAGVTTASHPRLLVVAGAHSQARVIESYEESHDEAAGGFADRPYFTNAVTEIVLEAGAVLDHYKVQREGTRASHFGSTYVSAGRGSTFSSHSFALGGVLVRNEVVVTLGGEGVDCTLNGLYLGGGASLVDNHTTIDHATPHGSSHEVYKGILWDRARAVFNGKIVVRPDAQKTDAKQTNKALLLSDDAQVNTKPELEIFANDVKCTHGAAIGQLDGDAIFYLRSRGLDAAQARNLLIHAFAGDIIHRVQVPALRAELEATLTTRLPAIES